MPKAFDYAEIAVPTDAVLAFNYVRTFLEVADAGGVSPAARRLGVSKSIVSRRLARLEQALGVQLLSRTTHGAVPTEAVRQDLAALISSAARPPIMYDAALVPGPEMIDGMTDASATRSPRSP